MSDWKQWKEKLAHIKGVEWLILLILLGVLGSLLLRSENNNGWLGTASDKSLEGRLSSVLSSIADAGRVRVMVYYGQGNDPNTTLFGETVASTQEPVGVVVVADGASDLRVRLELIRAVQTLMNLPADAVEVFRMQPIIE